MLMINPREGVGNNKPDVLKGLAAGTIAGLVGSWVMEEFQAVWIKASKALQYSQGNGSNESSSRTPAGAPAGEPSADGGEEQEPATVKAAEMIYEKILGRQLAEDEKEMAGEAVHYATGAASGAIYGAAAELAPDVTAGGGIPFGTAVW